jgi:aspartate carbamoyltransferase catalytic subunit
MDGAGRHLLDVDEISAADAERILARAQNFLADGGAANELAGTRVALVFAEPSTRTRLSFEIAARDLGAQTFVIEPGASSMVKGETLVDTCRNLSALGLDMLVLRHHRAGAPWVAARHFGGAVVNAGDGWHAHPTQALLDLLTLRRALGGAERLRGRKVVIVGDVLHSRVAKSNVLTLRAAGMDVWLCGPAPWLRGLETLPAGLTSDLDEGLRDASAVMGLRVQRERMRGSALSLDQYIAHYQLTERRLARAAPEAFFLHPGPINEGVEVTREVARGPRSLVLDQVRNGVAVRMAVLLRAAAGLDGDDRLEPRPVPSGANAGSNIYRADTAD